MPFRSARIITGHRVCTMQLDVERGIVHHRCNERRNDSESPFQLPNAPEGACVHIRRGNDARALPGSEHSGFLGRGRRPVRPLPYPRPDRLAEVATEIRGPAGQGIEDSQDGAAWESLRQARSFDLAAMGGGFTGVNLVSGGAAIYVQQSRCSAGYFRTLGIVPAIGREFTPDEDRIGGPASVMLSNGLWRSAFRGDPSIAGRSILVRGEPHTVVGILPERFRSMAPADVWTPLRPSTRGEGGGTNYSFIARLH